MMFFFVFFFQLIILVVQTIGLTSKFPLASRLISVSVISWLNFVDGGTIGMITAIETFNGSVMGTLLGLFCLCIAIGFGVAAGGNALLLTRVCFEFGSVLNEKLMAKLYFLRFTQSTVAAAPAWTKAFKSFNGSFSATRLYNKLELTSPVTPCNPN
jgi:SCAMP family